MGALLKHYFNNVIKPLQESELIGDFEIIPSPSEKNEYQGTIEVYGEP